MGFSSLLMYLSLFVSLFVEVFLLITYFEIRDELKFEKENTARNLAHYPSVTIIVPCFNEAKTVSATLSSLLALDYPSEKLQLVIVNDGSTDATELSLQTFADNPRVRIFSKENGGKHTALNFALEKIETDLVGCLDADSFVDAQALRKIVSYFENSEIMAVTPAVKIYEPKTILQQIQKVEYNWGILWRRVLASIDGLYVTPGPFSIFRTKTFKKIGGYRHAHHTEDLEMALRLQKHRMKISNAPGAYVYTVGPANWRGLYKQRVRWTYGFLNNAFDYREMFFNRKFGSIGIFVLPVATFSIFTALYSTSRLLWSLMTSVGNKISEYQAVGFYQLFHTPHVNLGWFYFNTGIGSILTICALAMSITILALAIHTAEGKIRFERGIIYYLTIYIFLVPLWLAKATYSTLTRANITWR